MPPLHPWHTDHLNFFEQLYFWTYSLSSPRWRNLLCWLVGCELFLVTSHVLSSNLNDVDRCKYNRGNSLSSINRLGLCGPGHGSCEHWFQRKLCCHLCTDFVGSLTIFLTSTYFICAQWCVCYNHTFARCFMLPWDRGACQAANSLCGSECCVSLLLRSMDILKSLRSFLASAWPSLLLSLLPRQRNSGTLRNLL